MMVIQSAGGEDSSVNRGRGNQKKGECLKAVCFMEKVVFFFPSFFCTTIRLFSQCVIEDGTQC